MYPVSNQPGGVFEKAKTYPLSSINDITFENLKLRLTMDLTRRYTFNASTLLGII